MQHEMTAEHGPNRLAHRAFLLAILAKGLLGLTQLTAAAAIWFRATDALPGIAEWLVRAELVEDPSDFLASRIIALANALPGTDLSFYALYFAAHGLLHVSVVGALLLGRRWAYPATILVLAGFIVFQILDWIAAGGVMLLILSVIDLGVIWLTWNEWRQRALS
jgi:uncharacterized membrane protein